MKTKLFSIALGAALTVASTLSLADRGRHDDDDRHHYRHDSRGDYRVEQPRRWGHPHWKHYRHHRHEQHYYPSQQYRHHVHDRWCGHYAEPPRQGPRYSGPRHSGAHDGGYSNGRITLIFSTDLN